MLRSAIQKMRCQSVYQFRCACPTKLPQRMPVELAQLRGAIKHIGSKGLSMSRRAKDGNKFLACRCKCDTAPGAAVGWISTSTLYGRRSLRNFAAVCASGCGIGVDASAAHDSARASAQIREHVRACVRGRARGRERHSLPRRHGKAPRVGVLP